MIMKSNKHTIISPNIESSSIKCANEKNPFYYHGAELIQHYNDTIKKSSISLIQISADDSFSLISTDNTFSENYQRQNINSYIHYIPEQQREYITKEIAKHRLKKSLFQIEHTLLKKDNTVTQFHVYGNFLKQQNDTFICTLLLIENSQYKHFKKQLKDCFISMTETNSCHHKRKVVFPQSLESNINAMPVLFEYKPEKNTLYFSNLVKQTYYFPFYTLKETILIHNNDKEYFYILLKYCQNHRGMVQTKIRLYTSENKYQWFYLIFYTLCSKNNKKRISIYGKLMPIFTPGITMNEIKRDAITNLYHRNALEQYINLSLQDPLTNQSAFILIDLPNLKNIYNTIGIPLGDMVLNDIVQKIKKHFYQTDVIARYTYDKIVVYLPNIISKTILQHTINKMNTIFHTTYGNNENSYTVNPHTGISLYPHDGNSYQSLLRCANKALKHSAEINNHHFLFYEDYKKNNSNTPK